MATNSTPGQTPKRTVLTISIDQIDLTDTKFQVRESIDEGKLKEYEQLLRDSGSSDLSAFRSRPLVWKRPDGRYVVLDGWHRIHAAKAVSIKQFDVTVLEENKTQAVIQAMRSNLAHGLPLTSQERLQACLRTIEALTTPDGTQPSNERVAGLLGVGEGTIRNYRGQLETVGKLKSAVNVIGKDGKIQAAKKATTKKPAAELSKAVVPESEGSTALKPSPPAGQSDRSSVLVNRNWDEAKKMLNIPTPDAIPINTACSSEDREILKRATAIVSGLDARAWQACPDREELAGLVDEVVKAGTAALKAIGVAKTGEKAV